MGAVLGRIWVLCRNLMTKIYSMYSHLTSILMNLPGESIEYLKLPEGLRGHATEDLLEHLLNETGSNNKETEVGITVDDFLDIGTPVKRLIETDPPEKKPQTESLLLVPTPKTDDVVPFKKLKVESFPLEETLKKDEKKDVLSYIHSLNDLKLFIEKETEVRKTSKKTSFTRKLNQDQWKAVKKEVLKTMNPSLPNKSIKLCRKIIRNALK